MLPPPWSHSTTPILSAPKFCTPHLRKSASVEDLPMLALLPSSTLISLPFSMTNRWFASSSTEELCQNLVPPVWITYRTFEFAVAACISLRSSVAFPPANNLDSRSVPHKYTKIVQLPFSPIEADPCCSGLRISIFPVALSTCMKRPLDDLEASALVSVVAGSEPASSAGVVSSYSVSSYSASSLQPVRQIMLTSRTAINKQAIKCFLRISWPSQLLLCHNKVSGGRFF